MKPTRQAWLFPSALQNRIYRTFPALPIRRLSRLGSLYPQDLSLHEIMFTMPPGDRELLDYVRIPLDTWHDPQVLSPDLLRSIWGTTYTSLYFDGHRHFLQRDGEDVRRALEIVPLRG